MTFGAEAESDAGWTDDDVRSLAEKVAREPSPSPAELERLGRLAATGDPSARERLFELNTPLLVKLAQARTGRGLDLRDLLHEGSLGLVAAINDYEPDPSAGLEAHLQRAVAQHLDTALENESAAERERQQLIEDAEAYQQAEIEIGNLLGRQATAAELAEKLEWSQVRTRRLGDMVREARRRHDEDIVRYLDPNTADAADFQPDLDDLDALER